MRAARSVDRLLIDLHPGRLETNPIPRQTEPILPQDYFGVALRHNGFLDMSFCVSLIDSRACREAR